MSTWIYYINNKVLIDPVGDKISCQIYSGCLDGYNNSTKCNIPNVGPIPPNYYQIGIAYTHKLAGPVTMNLTAFDKTKLFGRDGFMIHGDTVEHMKNPNPDTSCSHGCIVIEPRSVRELIANSSVKTIQVIAYGPP